MPRSNSVPLMLRRRSAMPSKTQLGDVVRAQVLLDGLLIFGPQPLAQLTQRLHERAAMLVVSVPWSAPLIAPADAGPDSIPRLKGCTPAKFSGIFRTTSSTETRHIES